MSLFSSCSVSFFFFFKRDHHSGLACLHYAFVVFYFYALKPSFLYYWCIYTLPVVLSTLSHLGESISFRRPNLGFILVLFCGDFLWPPFGMQLQASFRMTLANLLCAVANLLCTVANTHTRSLCLSCRCALFPGIVTEHDCSDTTLNHVRTNSLYVEHRLWKFKLWTWKSISLTKFGLMQQVCRKWNKLTCYPAYWITCPKFVCPKLYLVTY